MHTGGVGRSRCASHCDRSHDFGSGCCRRRLLARGGTRRSRLPVRGHVDRRGCRAARGGVGTHRLWTRLLGASPRESIRPPPGGCGLCLVPARMEQPRDRLVFCVHGRSLLVRSVPAARRARSPRIPQRPSRLVSGALRRRRRVRRRLARSRRLAGTLLRPASARVQRSVRATCSPSRTRRRCRAT